MSEIGEDTSVTGAAQQGVTAKSLGAFYTDVQIADLLVWWGVRHAKDRVLDPSFGGGVFLRSACEYLGELGGQPARQVLGFEIDRAVFHRIGAKLHDEFGVSPRNLYQGDFFEVDPTPSRQVDVVVGNPPFIRYHRFRGESRRRALARARAAGVVLSRLSSSWAPFAVHSVAHLKDRGRLAMVLPMELTHAAYGLPVLRHLVQSFGRITLLTFKTKLFPGLSEDTLLLLAEGKGAGPATVLWRDLSCPGSLAAIRRQGTLPIKGTRRVDAQGLAAGDQRLVECYVPRKARELYRELQANESTRRLGELANIGIGYVTGCNEFFHLSSDAVAEWSIPHKYLRPAVVRARALRGTRFTSRDWMNAVSSGEARFLLLLSADSELPEPVRRYLRHGQSMGIPKAYKCRTRSPWYRVPHVHQPDAFLSYMSGSSPRLVANSAGVVVPNTLHMVRLRALLGTSAEQLASAWNTSLCRLSAEIEGHSLGGGMLKLEPSEAERVLIPTCGARDPALRTISSELDALLRAGAERAANDLADAAVLRSRLGLSVKECELLQGAADVLRGRRYARGSAA